MLKALQLSLLLVLLLETTPGCGQTNKPEAARALTREAAAEAAPANNLLTVNAGERLFLQLATGLNTDSTRIGDPVEFKTAEDTWVDGRVAIPRGSSVSGEVSKVRRPGRLNGRAEIGLRVCQLTLAHGTSLPLRVSLVRAGFTQVSPNEGNPSLKGEGGRGLSLAGIAEIGIQGAMMGGAYGAVVGLGLGLVTELFQRAPALDLPRDMVFEVVLSKSLDVTAAAAQGAAQLAHNTFRYASKSTSSLPEETVSEGSREPVPDFNRDETLVDAKSSEATETTEVTAALTTLPVPQSPLGDTRRATPVLEGTDHADEFKLKVDVQLVMVDAVVRNRLGRPIDNLHREDFRVFEDGIEQPITSFSRDKLPLAIALVVDRSGSVAPIMNALRRAAYQTLTQLKAGDQVALLAFADAAQRLEDLTPDRQRIADRIATIEPGGATNINDALFDAIHYLSSVARDRRRAVILISDNEATVKGHSSERKLIRLATESETVVYSIKIVPQFPPMAVGILPWLNGAHLVAKVTHETGGEIIDAPDKQSLRVALATVVSRLKLRYALGYQPAHAHTSGAFRKIDVRLADRFGQVDSDYSIHARRGYYPSTQQVATQNRPRS